MGLPARANVRVCFKSQEQAEKYLEIMDDFDTNIEKELNKESVYTDVFGLDLSTKYGEYVVEFELNSSRVQNLDWQCQWAIHFAKQVGGCTEFSADKWIMGDSFSFTEPEEIESYEPDLS